jgi:hypothetical protein
VSGSANPSLLLAVNALMVRLGTPSPGCVQDPVHDLARIQQRCTPVDLLTAPVHTVDQQAMDKGEVDSSVGATPAALARPGHCQKLDRNMGLHGCCFLQSPAAIFRKALGKLPGRSSSTHAWQLRVSSPASQAKCACVLIAGIHMVEASMSLLYSKLASMIVSA